MLQASKKSKTHDIGAVFENKYYSGTLRAHEYNILDTKQMVV
jgi:hypothetical protein